MYLHVSIFMYHAPVGVYGLKDVASVLANLFINLVLKIQYHVTPAHILTSMHAPTYPPTHTHTGEGGGGGRLLRQK